MTVDDLVSALEARLRTDRSVVLRVTAPFVPRERARLHVVSDGDDSDGDGGRDGDEAIHLDPRELVDDDAPAYPRVDATEDRLREAGAYSVENHRRAHEAAVAAWREAVRDHLVETVTVEVDGDAVSLSLSYLG